MPCVRAASSALVCAIGLTAIACSGALDLDLDTRTRPCAPATGPATVRWFTPAAADHRRPLDAWCATVGSPVLSQPSTLSRRATRAAYRARLVERARRRRRHRGAARRPPIGPAHRWRGAAVRPAASGGVSHQRRHSDLAKADSRPRRASRHRPPTGRRVSTPDLASASRTAPRLRAEHAQRAWRRPPAGRPRVGNPVDHATERPARDRVAVSSGNVAWPSRRGSTTWREDDDLWLVNVHLENRTGGRPLLARGACGPRAAGPRAREEVPARRPGDPRRRPQHLGVERSPPSSC